jgi:hypothetical protein
VRWLFSTVNLAMICLRYDRPEIDNSRNISVAGNKPSMLSISIDGISSTMSPRSTAPIAELFPAFDGIAETRVSEINNTAPAIGPMAAGIADDVYRRLGEKNYFASAAPVTPASLIASRVQRHQRYHYHKTREPCG